MSVSDPLRTFSKTVTLSGMTTIDASLLRRLPLDEIERVTFYKRDEITTDLICCDVLIGGQVWIFHEELVGWHLLMEHLQKLPNFQKHWFGAVSKPPFAESETVAFSRE